MFSFLLEIEEVRKKPKKQLLKQLIFWKNSWFLFFRKTEQITETDHLFLFDLFLFLLCFFSNCFFLFLFFSKTETVPMHNFKCSAHFFQYIIDRFLTGLFGEMSYDFPKKSFWHALELFVRTTRIFVKLIQDGWD